MARTRPADRLDQLVLAAARVFTRRGYRRTQMADVAQAMGVAPGTLYLYVESKEALFDLVVQRAFVAEGDLPPLDLPVRTPAAGVTLAHLRRRAHVHGATPLLDAALRRRRPADAEEELAGVVGELYRNLLRSHRAVALLERSSLDWPELAEVWYGEIRHQTIDKLTRYLERRVRQKLLRGVPHVEVAARLLLETVAWAALHRHGDHDPPRADESAVEQTTVDLIVHAWIGRKR